MRHLSWVLGSMGCAVVVLGCPERRDPSSNYPAYPPPGYGSPPGYPPAGYPPAQPTPQPMPTFTTPTYPVPTYTAPAPMPTQPAPVPTQPAPGPAPAPTTAPTAAPTGGFPWPWPFPAPGGGGGGGAASSGAATPMDPNVANAAVAPLMALAVQEAPGMQREGPTIAGQFKEGQTLEQATQLLPGKCYTVLAVGVGIVEMDIQLIANTPLPGASPVLAQDSGSGASASLGGKGNCFKWSYPVGVQAKYVLRATKGEGIAAGQLYSK